MAEEPETDRPERIEDAPPPDQKAKSIVLFSDGTGNSSAKLFKTNVWRMYEAVDLGPPSPPKRKQIAFYDNGVGTSSLRPIAAITGIFGFGLKRNVLEIYRYACRNYTPAAGERPGEEAPSGGDEIYAFGFSRGAFTIRILIALIADQGLVAATDERELVRKSKDAYRAFRTRFLPRRLAWPTRLWRSGRAALSRGWRNLRGIEHYDGTKNYRPAIRFVGVWDTVAAYGGPVVEITRAIDNWFYALSMPNYRLSRRVQCARHALAIDDERDAFHPLLWDEVHEDRLVENGMAREGRLQQVWFTGMHADVGGGYPDESLSYVSFLWMQQEAVKHGLRTVDVVTDRFRALASSAGPLHDSRSGPGAYYRYQPRNIGAWLHPPDTESIVHDPTLRDRQGKPQGLLTSVQVHESVIARIATGTDGYAPFTLPDRLRIVPPHAGAENALQQDSETPIAPPAEEQDAVPLISPELRRRVEDPKVGAARCAALASVWDLVWRRRVMYFATLFLTIALLLMPLWIEHAPPPPLLADGRTWIGAFIRMLSVVTPDFLDPLIETMADNAFYFFALLGAIILLMWRSKVLERRMRDRSRAIWRETLVVDGPLPQSQRASLIQKIRTHKGYRRFFRVLKWRVLPGLVAVILLALLLWMLAGLYTQIRLPALEKGKTICRPLGAVPALDAVKLDFSTAAPCLPVGRAVREGQRYVVEFTVTSRWKDGRTADGHPTDPGGLSAWEMGAAGVAGIPFRRVITAGYLQPIFEIRRGPGRLQWSDRVYIDALELERGEEGPAVWRGEFVAPESGELFLFSNEAVLPFRQVDYLYDHRKFGNEGAACVIIRRADADAAAAPRCAAGAMTEEGPSR